MRTPRKWATLSTGAAFALLLAASPLLAQQRGTVTGMIQDQQGQPVAGAQVSVTGTPLGTLSREDGRYIIQQVPTGAQTVRVQRIGFAASSGTVSVQAGQTHTLDFTLREEAVALEQIIVTGVAQATSRAKVPFEVAQLTTEDLPVPAVDAVSAIQGKVAGASVVSGSGRPGDAPSVLLRGATSIDASGRSQEPLYIVDGVILGSSMVDIDAMDIESIEVIKGAAAASLYGSRAGNGVIQITTNRGQGFADGEVRYTVRSSLGQSDLPGSFPVLQRHFWELTPDGTMFIDDDGTPCHFRGTPSWRENPTEPECSGVLRENGTDAWDSYAINEWPDGTFDHVDRFFPGGGFQEHYVGASGRQGNTNFLVSFSQQDDKGVMFDHEGFQRRNFRVNVDQVIRPELSLSASAFYSRSMQNGSDGGGSIFGITRMQAGVDLAGCEPGINKTSCTDDPQNLLLNVNPTNEESENPLYDLLAQRIENRRGRFMASSELRWSPVNWFDLSGDVSYDRLDTDNLGSLPKGYRTLNDNPSVNEGTLSISNNVSEALNASMTAAFRATMGDGITNRTQFRYIYEQEDNSFNSVGGNTFAVADVPRINNLDNETISGSSSVSAIRADGYFAITNFDLYDRYIVDALIRNDGSSLFGADERRQWYYRGAFAWRLTEEPWFDIGGLDELKFRLSQGTAGGRPSFAAQYETFSVSAGTVIPVNLGNRALKPEHSTETEFGIDATLFERLDLTVTRAITNTENQIISVPLPAFTGFSSQVQNVGTLESKTWEFSLGGRLIQNRNMSWSARLLYDNTTSIITELNRPSFRYGVGGQGLGSVFFAREGEELGTFYGPIAARTCANLPEGTDCSEFTVNGDGYLVWVGDGSLSDNAWGTTGDVNGVSYTWGTVFAGECVDRETEERTSTCPVGNTLPDFNVSFSSTFTLGGLSIYGLLDAVQGFDVYNQPLQWAVFRRNVDMYNQAGVPEADRKPIGYFDALYGRLGGLTPNDVFVEDASFVKLRELSLSYRVSPEMLTAVPGLRVLSGVSLNVSGRNLMTWSDYRGYDPEVGRDGGDVGSAALARVDGYNYPNFRTWTFGAEVSF